MKKFFKSTEIKIAIVAIVGLFLLIWGINFLKGRDIFKRQNTFYAVFDSSMGLLTSHLVMVNGIKIGIVEDVKMMSQNANKILVTLKVESKYTIPDDSRMKINVPNLFSSPQIDIVMGKNSTFLSSGDTLIGFAESGMLDNINAVIPRLVTVSASVDTIALRIKEILLQGTIEQSLENIRSLSQRLDNIIAANQGNINEIVSDVHGLTNTIQKNDTKINNIIDNLNEVSNQLAQAQLKGTIDEAKSAIARLDTLIGYVNSGEGTVGQLVKNDSLYLSLNGSLVSLNALLTDIKANPKRYINVTVFGKKEKNK